MGFALARWPVSHASAGGKPDGGHLATKEMCRTTGPFRARRQHTQYDLQLLPAEPQTNDAHNYQRNAQQTKRAVRLAEQENAEDDRPGNTNAV